MSEVIGTVRLFIDQGTKNLADVSLRADDLARDYEDRVLNFGHIDRSLAYPAGSVQVGDAQIKLADTDKSVRGWWAETTLRRRQAELKLFLDTDLTDPSPAITVDDIEPVFTGEIVDADFDSGSGLSKLRDTMFSWLDKPIPPLGTPDNFPNLPSGVTSVFIPLRFGRLESYSQGSPAIALLPIGVCACPYVDAVQFRYAVARTTVNDVIAVYRKRVTEGYFTIVDPSEFNVVTEDLFAAGITYTITYIQFIIKQDDGTEIRADISGVDYRGAFGVAPWNLDPVTGESRNAADHLINALYYFLELEGRTAQYNSESFYRLRQDLIDRGYKCDADIDGKSATTPRELIAQFSASQGIDFKTDRYGRMTVALDPLSDIDTGSPIERVVFTEDDVEKGTFKPSVKPQTANRIRCRYAPYGDTNDQWGFEIIVDNTADQVELLGSASPAVGNIEEIPFDLPFVRDDATAIAVLKARIGYYTLRSWPISFQLALPDYALQLDLGDTIGLTHREGIKTFNPSEQIVGWVDEPFKVVGLTYDLDKTLLTVTAIRYYPAASLTLSVTVGNTVGWNPSDGHATRTAQTPNPPDNAAKYSPRVGGPGLQTIGTDVTDNRYRLAYKFSLQNVATTSKIGPSGGYYAADILFSVDDGLGWTSIFSAGDTNKAHIADGDYKGDQSTGLATTVFDADTLFRVDVLHVNGATGLEIVMVGKVIN